MINLVSSMPFQLFAAACDKGKTFFGLPVWYKYLPDDGADMFGSCNLKIDNITQYALIGLALVEVLLRIGGIVAFGYIVWGGLQMVLSQGEPDKRVKAISTITNAVIGLVITLLAVGILSFIAGKF
jgi:hypothetical protein